MVTVTERVAEMGMVLGLSTTPKGNALLKTLEGVMQDAVIDRLSQRELHKLVIAVIRPSNVRGKGVGKSEHMAKSVMTSLMAGGALAKSTSDDGYYIRGHDGQWACLSPHSIRPEKCDSVARIESAVVDITTSNRALQSIASAALVRNAKGGVDFRLLKRGASKKQGSICTQTSTYTLLQLKQLCVSTLQTHDRSIPTDPLDDMPKKLLCRVYELALRLHREVFARPSQMLDAIHHIR